MRYRLRSAAALTSLLLFTILAAPARAAEPGDLLTPVGQAVAIELRTEGMLVAGLASVETAEGMVSPAGSAGMEAGDRITAVNGSAIAGSEDFIAAVAALTGESVELTAERNGEMVRFTLTPALGLDGARYLGLWLRDSIAGIGTVTFQDPASGLFGALGHGVCSGSSNALTPVTGGVLAPATVTDVVAGSRGKPGELVGAPQEGAALGEVTANTAAGIFGHAAPLGGAAALPAASDAEIRLGAAEILSTVAGTQPQAFGVEITRIVRGGEDLRQLSLTVTDAALIERAGGIVQGMSGSPIVQDGKIVGAVTHVLVEDPTRGYGVTIESMLAKERAAA